MAASLKLYGFWRSLATHRVRVALHLKGLAFEDVPVDLLAGEQHAMDFRDGVNPAGAVPALVAGGRTITQSSAIFEWLEETYPSPALLPADPYHRARVRAFTMVTIADAHPLVVPRVRRHVATTFGADDAAVAAWCRHWLTEGLKVFESLLADPDRPAGDFAWGSAPTYADAALASHLVGMQLFGAPRDGYPRVAAVAARLAELPAVVKSDPFAQVGAPPRP